MLWLPGARCSGGRGGSSVTSVAVDVVRSSITAADSASSALMDDSSSVLLRSVDPKPSPYRGRRHRIAQVVSSQLSVPYGSRNPSEVRRDPSAVQPEVPTMRKAQWVES